jgi:hypothetical protein
VRAVNDRRPVPGPLAGVGQDIDLTRPLPPDPITAAAQADPEMTKVVGPYQAMLALPSSLDTYPLFPV